MTELNWVIGIMSAIALYLVVADYRDYAKRKKNERNNSTFFKDDKE